MSEKMPPAVAALIASITGQAMAQATEAQKYKYDKPQVDRHDQPRICLPRELPYDEAKTWIDKAKESETRKVAIHAEIPCFPTDGLACFWRVLVDTCGFVNITDTPSFWGKNPPVFVNIRTGPSPSDQIQVPYGRMETPAFPGGFLQTSFNTSPGRMPALVIGGEVKAMHKPVIDYVIARVKEELLKTSIYKGKAVKISFDFLDSEDGFDFDNDAPSYLSTSSTDPDSLILPVSVRSALDVGLFAPIERTEAFRINKIPLKTGVILAGTFGTGKTLTAEVVAKKCVDNGWTYLYLNDVRRLADALRLARTLTPCVVFAEDVDRATSGDRSAKLDEILNTIDGVDFKNAEILCVFTTNSVESINPAMIRPGRIDTVVQFTTPDAPTAERLIRVYARNLLTPDCDLSEASAVIAQNEMIPASIRAVVEKAKAATLLREGVLSRNVNADDILKAAYTMQEHLAFVNRKTPTAPTPLDLARASSETGLSKLAASNNALVTALEGLQLTARPPHIPTEPVITQPKARANSH